MNDIALTASPAAHRDGTGARAAGVLERRESQVRSYCRTFPVVFRSARDAFLYDEHGREYIDFFAGAGALNYGHNDPAMKSALIEYLQRDGVLHSLDMWTVAKREFLEKFEEVVLAPRRLEYKVQFTGPTGANAVEAALKLARKVTRRSNVVSFTNGYHGLSAGALAATGNRHFRDEAFVARANVSFMPYDGYFGADVDTLEYLRRFLADASSGLDVPAAVIVETVQAEGGVNVARLDWLRSLERLCREFGILLIVDDIQTGNGRTGTFFSFEAAGIRPDLVTLSKSIGGIGLPMSLVLIDPAIDAWKPAEHTGTFRGNNLAFVAAASALRYWETEELATAVARKGRVLADRLREVVSRHPRHALKARGRGLIHGLELPSTADAREIARGAFERGVVIELAGSDDRVLKFLPPLTIEDAVLTRGLDVVCETAEAVLLRRERT